MSLYKIQDITPSYNTEGYEKDSDGKILLPRRIHIISGKECSVPYIIFKNTHAYADGLIGLMDGEILNHKDWEDMHKAFGFIYPDGSERLIYTVTGSESATVMGLNPYSTAEKLRRKKNFNYEEEISVDTEFIFEFGHRNEELVGIGFHYKTGREVFTDNSIFYNTKNGVMMANTDFFTVPAGHELNVFGASILEAKTTSATQTWADKDAPSHYKVQALLFYNKCLEALNLEGTYIAGLYDNRLNNIMVRYFDRMPTLEERLEKACKKFVSYCYNEDTIPYGLFGEEDETIEKDIKSFFPIAENEETIELSEDMGSDVTAYIDLKDKISLLEKEVKSLKKDMLPFENSIKESIGKNKFATYAFDDTNFKFTYGNREGRISVDTDKILYNYPKIWDTFLEEGIIKRGKAYRVLTLSRKKKSAKELKAKEA